MSLAAPVGAQPLVKNGDLVAVVGDSITEQREYSVVIENYLRACAPASKAAAIQFGWSGENAPQLVNRIDNDVIPFKPNVVTTCYGMNDGGYGPIDDAKAKRYRDAMTSIVTKLKAAGVRQVIVGAPGCVDPSQFKRTDANTYNETLKALGAIAKEVAAEQQVAHADVFGVMYDTLQKADAKWGAPYEFAGADGFHPGPNGHLAMAFAFLKAMGFDGQIGTVTVDLAPNKATASEGHVATLGPDGTVQIESTRWPYCFVSQSDKKNEPRSAKTITQVLPFQEELNRFILVVNGVAPTGSATVTWGTQSKKFTGDQLSRGINLAAEFVDDNPFSEPFTKLDTAVRNKQGFEVPLVKKLITNIPSLAKLVDDPTDLDRVRASATKRHAKMMDEASDAVVPVKHTLKVTVEK